MIDGTLSNALAAYEGLSEKDRADFMDLVLRQAAITSPSFLSDKDWTVSQSGSSSPLPTATPASEPVTESAPATPSSSSSSAVFAPHEKHDSSPAPDAWLRVAATISALQTSRERSLSRGGSIDNRVPRPSIGQEASVERSRIPTKIPVPVVSDDKRSQSASSEIRQRNREEGRRYGGEFERPGERAIDSHAISGTTNDDTLPRSSYTIDDRQGLQLSPREASVDRGSPVPEQRGREKERGRRDRDRKKSSDEVDSVTIRTPDEVRPILQALRRLQRSEAGSLFEGMDVPSADGTPRKDSSSRPRHPFYHIERHITDILTLAPSIILRTMTPRTPPNFPHLRRSNSRGQSVSPSRPRSPAHNTTEPHLTPNITTPTSSPTSTAPQTPQKDPLSNAPALARVASASSHLATLIETLISLHNDRILSLMTSNSDLEEYQKCSERVLESTFGVLKGVKRLREWDAGVGVWEGAKDLYAGLILDVLHFVQGVSVFTQFCWRCLEGARGGEREERVERRVKALILGDDVEERMGLPSPPVETVMPGEMVGSTGATFSPSPSPDLEKEKGKAKRKSIGARIKERISLLSNDTSRRVSISSFSSEESLPSSNSSHPTRVSRNSDSSAAGNIITNVLDLYRTGSPPPSTPGSVTASSSRRSIEIPMGRSSLDSPRGLEGLRGRSSLELARPRNSYDGGGHVGRGSLDAGMQGRGGPSNVAPRLPEMNFEPRSRSPVGERSEGGVATRPRGFSVGRSPLGVPVENLSIVDSGRPVSVSLPASSSAFTTHYSTTPRPHRNSIGASSMVIRRPSNNLSIRIANQDEVQPTSWRPIRLPFETDDESERHEPSHSADHQDQHDQKADRNSDEDDRAGTLTFNRWSRMVMDVAVLPSVTDLDHRRRPKSMYDGGVEAHARARARVERRRREEESESEWDVRAASDDEILMGGRREGLVRWGEVQTDPRDRDEEGEGDAEDEEREEDVRRKRFSRKRSKTPLSPAESVESVGSVGAVVEGDRVSPIGENSPRPRRPLPPLPLDDENPPPEEVVLPPVVEAVRRVVMEEEALTERSSMDSERSAGTGATMSVTAEERTDDETGSDVPKRVKSSKRFDRLKTVDRKSSQRIPTYDSHGRWIGMLDHGRFSGIGNNEIAETEQQDHAGGPGKNAISVRGDLLYLNEDNREVLVMHMLGDKLHIVAGTVEKLLLRLADENFQDMEYVDCLIQNHAFFIDSQDLLENLVARFHAQPPENPTEGDIDYFNKWRRPIQLKVLTVIGRWVKLQYEDFAELPALRALLESFLDQIWHTGYKNEADRIRRGGSLQAMVIASRDKTSPFPRHLLDRTSTSPFSAGARCPFPILAVTSPGQMITLPFGVGVGSGKEKLNDSTPLLDCEARDLARYLTAAAWHAFRSITVYDYVARLVGGEGEAGQKGRIDLLASRSNMLRNWVALEICSLGKLKARRKLIEKFISVAKYCRDHNNFHTTLLIVSGLLSPPVQRLKRTWDAVSTAHASALSSLEKLLDPSGNMRNYRKALAMATTPALNPATGQTVTPGPCVPFFPVVMKDVTFVMDGNPAFVQGWSPAGSADEPPQVVEESSKLVNFDKYRSLSKIIGRYLSGAEGTSANGLTDRHNTFAANAEFYSGTTGVMHVLPHLLRAVYGGGGPAQHAIAAVGAGAVGKAYWGSNPAELEHVAVTVETRLAFADDDGLAGIMRSGGSGEGSEAIGKAGMGKCMGLAWSMAGKAEGESD